MKYFINIENYLNQNQYQFLFILFLYFLSFGLILINDGLFWDDWCFYFNGNESSILSYANSAGLPLNGIITNFILSLPFSIIIYRFLIFILYLFAGYNFYKILKDIEIMDKPDRFWLTSIFLIVPTNFARISFMNFQHALAYATFYFAFNLLLQKNKTILLRIIILILFYFSFNTNSFLLFYTIPIFYFWYSSRYHKKKLKSIFSFIKGNIDFIILPFIYWIIKIYYFPAFGVFEGYNEIKLINIIISPLKALGAFYSSLIKIFSFNQINIFVVIILFLFIYRFVRSKQDTTNKNNVTFIIFGFISFYIAVAPYLFIGRSSFGYGSEWASRDQLLIPLSAAFIIYFSIKQILSIIFKSSKNINIIMSLILSIFIYLNFTNYLLFNLDWFRQLSLITQIKDSEKIKKSFNVIFKDNARHLNGLNREIRFYEFNGIFKIVYNDETRLGISESRIPPNYPNYFTKYKKYPEYNFLNYNGESENSLKIILNPGITRLTAYEIVRLIYFRIFNKQSFRNYLSKIITLEYSD